MGDCFFLLNIAASLNVKTQIIPHLTTHRTEYKYLMLKHCGLVWINHQQDLTNTIQVYLLTNKIPGISPHEPFLNFKVYEYGSWMSLESEIRQDNRYEDVFVSIIGDNWFLLQKRRGLNIHNELPFVPDFWCTYRTPIAHKRFIMYVDVQGPRVQNANITNMILKTTDKYRDNGAYHLDSCKIGYRMHVAQFKNIHDLNDFYFRYIYEFRYYYANSQDVGKFVEEGTERVFLRILFTWSTFSLIQDVIKMIINA